MVAFGFGVVSWSCLGRRSLRLGAIGLRPSLGLGALLLQIMCFQSGQLCTVTEKDLNQAALVLNGTSLFHDQSGHQAIGNQEQDDQNWE